MTAVSKPFAGATGPNKVTDAEYRQYFRLITGSGFVPGSFVPTADGGGLYVDLSAGLATVEAPFYLNRDPTRVTVTAGSLQPRIDTLVLELDPSRTPDIIIIRVLEGTPAATPVPPALTVTETGVFQLPICDIRRSASSPTVQQSDITDRRLVHTMGQAYSDTEPQGTPEGHVWLKPIL